MAEFFNLPDQREIIGLDYETTGLEYWKPDFRVLGFSVAVTTPDGISAQYYDLATHPRALEWLRDNIPGRRVVAQNAQFEAQCSRVCGVDPRSVDWYCTMVNQCLINEHELTYDLASVAAMNGVDSQKSEWLRRLMAALGVDTRAQTLARLSAAPPDLVEGYGSSDASDTLSIYYSQQRELEKQDLWRVSKLEMDLLPVLADMSWTGVRVDLEAAHAAIPKLDEREYVLQKEINEIVGRPFNVNSTPQLRDFFKPESVNRFQWRCIDGTLVGPTKSGKGPSLGQDALREFQHPLAAKILALRKIIKLRDTFIRGHVIGSADENGYVHTSFNQTRNDQDAGTITGRLSSTGPALQQITKRDKENAAILRAMFLPDHGEEWCCVDYSQVDFRCGAHLINDPSLIDNYWRDPSLDYHQIVSDMTGIPRNPPYAGAPNTKQINLGMQFGAGPGKLAFMMKMPHEVREYKGKMQYVPGPEAEAIFAQYHARLPGVKKFAKHAEAVARESGYVRTITGRRLRFPRGRGAHKAAGLLYQAHAADLHKVGLIRTDALLRREGVGRLMVSVHDEEGISMPRDEELKKKIVEEYCDFQSDRAPFKMRVPITSSGDFGPNWWEASKN